MVLGNGRRYVKLFGCLLLFVGLIRWNFCYCLLSVYLFSNFPFHHILLFYHCYQIGTILKTRSNVQIKSHGQKILDRQAKGENIFLPLEEASSNEIIAIEYDQPTAKNSMNNDDGNDGGNDDDGQRQVQEIKKKEALKNIVVPPLPLMMMMSNKKYDFTDKEAKVVMALCQIKNTIVTTPEILILSEEEDVRPVTPEIQEV